MLPDGPLDSVQALVQVRGLFGEDGLQPVSSQLTAWRGQLGASKTPMELMTSIPTLLWFAEDWAMLPETVAVRERPGRNRRCTPLVAFADSQQLFWRENTV